MRIAVIGSGLAGMTAAWALSEKADVYLFEKQNSAGMDAGSIDYPVGDSTVRIDVPLRVFYEGYYPTLSKLYDQIGAEFHPVDYAASFAYSGKPVYFRYINFLMGNWSFPFLGGLLSFRKKSRHLLGQLGRWYRVIKADLESNAPEMKLPIAEYLKLRGFSDSFYREFLQPIFSAICTCTYEAVDRYPAELVIIYFRGGVTMTGVRRVREGTQKVVSLLTKRVKEHNTGLAIESVKPLGTGLLVTGEDGRRLEVDSVVFATPGHRARAILDESFTEERELLSHFPYEKTKVTMHNDPSFMPAKRKHWSPVNFVHTPEGDATMATIWMNQVQPDLYGEAPVFQTWNPLYEPAEDKVLARSSFERPTVTVDSRAALVKLHELQKRPGRNVLFCGSYVFDGIPLLEGAVKSAVNAAELLLQKPVLLTAS